MVSHSIPSEGSADSACENLTSFGVFTHETSLKAGILKMASLQELKSGKYWMIAIFVHQINFPMLWGDRFSSCSGNKKNGLLYVDLLSLFHVFSLDNVSLPVSACQILLATGKPNVFTARKKVMFSKAYVSPSFHGGVWIQGGSASGGGVSASSGGCASRLGVGQTPQVCLRGDLHWGGLDRPPEIYGIQSTSGQYASYWNAFLFCYCKLISTRAPIQSS